MSDDRVPSSGRLFLWPPHAPRVVFDDVAVSFAPPRVVSRTPRGVLITLTRSCSYWLAVRAARRQPQDGPRADVGQGREPALAAAARGERRARDE